MGITSKNKAFTVIELLVVVIVLGILATITVVYYQGTREAAYNSQITSGVRAYYDAIKAYKLAKGEYPSTQREEDGYDVAMTCLGKGYEGGTCGSITGVQVYEDALFNSQMKTFLKTTTNPISDADLPVPGESFVGAAYGIDETDNSTTDYGRVIEYAVYGQNADCGIADAIEYSTSSDATACEIIFEEITP